MPRNNRPRGFRQPDDDDEPLDLARLRDGIAKTVIKNGIEFTVQTTSGKKAEDGKTWTCPSCHIVFGPGISHVVVWETDLGPQNRRHFHNICWQKYQGRLF